MRSDAQALPENTILATLDIVYIKNRRDLSHPWSSTQGGAVSNSVIDKLLSCNDAQILRIGNGDDVVD
jgi:hypothetical protein